VSSTVETSPEAGREMVAAECGASELDAADPATARHGAEACEFRRVCTLCCLYSAGRVWWCALSAVWFVLWCLLSVQCVGCVLRVLCVLCVAQAVWVFCVVCLPLEFQSQPWARRS
jgi:ABC-type anion transport system duplicated permease subunit